MILDSQKQMRRSSNSIQTLQKAQRGGVDKISPSTYSKNHAGTDEPSVANTALNLYRDQMNHSGVYLENKPDGMTPLAQTTRHIEWHNNSVSPSVANSRTSTDFASVASAFQRETVLDFAALYLKSSNIEGALSPSPSSTQEQKANVNLAEFYPKNTVGIDGRSLQEEGSPNSIVALQPKDTEGEDEKESAENPMQKNSSDIAVRGDAAVKAIAPALAQEAKGAKEGDAEGGKLGLDPDEADKEPPAIEVKIEAKAEAEAAAEAVAEDQGDAAKPEAAAEMVIRVIEKAEVEADYEVEVEPMPALEEVAAERNQAAEESILFAQEQQQQEEQMAKLFELPEITEEQMRLNGDIREACALVDEGRPQLQGRESRMLVILGETGSGKSTLANILAGREMTAAWTTDDGWKINVANPEGRYEGALAAAGRASPVGNDNNHSETRIPHKSIVENTAILDVPGFFDTKGFSTDVAHRMLYELSLENATSLKFILTVPEDIINGSKKRYEPFIKLLTAFGKMFSDIEAIEGSIALVVTRSSDKYNAEAYSKKIKKILETNPLINDPKAGEEGALTNEECALVKKVLEYVQDSVKVFYAPKEDGKMAQTLTLNDFAALSYSTAHHGGIPPSPASSILKNFLAGSDVSFLKEHKQKPEKTLEQLQFNIKIVNDIIINFFKEQLALNDHSAPDADPAMMHKSTSFIHKSLLPKGDEHNIFSRVYEDFTKGLLPTSYRGTSHLEEELPLEGAKKVGELFLKLRQIELIQQALKSSPANPRSDVEKLAEVLKILKALCIKNKPNPPADTNPGEEREERKEEEADIAVSEKIGACFHILEGLVKFEESCRKLCGADRPANLLASTVNECSALAQGIFEGAINALALAPKIFDGDQKGVKEYAYREEAVKWLKQFPNQDDSSIKEAQAHNYFRMGEICQKSGQWVDENKAIGHYKSAIDLNPEMKSAQENLGDIYLMQAKAHEEKAEEYKICAKVSARTTKMQEEMSQIKDYIRTLFPDKKQPEEGVGLFGAKIHKVNVDQPVVKPLPESSASKDKRESEAQHEEAIRLYKTALDPLIKAGNKAKVEECFAKILASNPYDVETLISKGDYYAGRNNIPDAHTAFSAYESAKCLSRDNPQKQAEINSKVSVACENLRSPSPHPIFEGYSMAPMIEVGSGSNSGFHISQYSSPSTPLRGIDSSPIASQRGLPLLPIPLSICVSPADGISMGSPRLDSPEFLDMPLAGAGGDGLMQV